MRVTERVERRPVNRRGAQALRQPRQLGGRVTMIAAAVLRSPADACHQPRQVPGDLCRPGVEVDQRERRVQDHRGHAPRIADRVGLGVGGGVGEAVEVEALDVQGGTDGLDVLRDVRAAVQVRPAPELGAARADRLVRLAAGLLERRAVDGLRQTGAAIVDQNDVAAVPQRPEQVGHEPLAAGLRGRDSRTSEGDEDRPLGRGRGVRMREHREEDPDARAVRSIAIEWHRDATAQRARHLVTRAKVLARPSGRRRGHVARHGGADQRRGVPRTLRSRHPVDVWRAAPSPRRRREGRQTRPAGARSSASRSFRVRASSTLRPGATRVKTRRAPSCSPSEPPPRAPCPHRGTRLQATLPRIAHRPPRATAAVSLAATHACSTKSERSRPRRRCAGSGR